MNLVPISLSCGVVILFSTLHRITPLQETQSVLPSATSQYSHPLMIEVMRQQTYPGSDITIEEELESGSNYSRYLASYQSDDLKIYALLTIPAGEQPYSGWPVIIFNHGHIPPEEYQTTARYLEYMDSFSRNGYLVFRPDYRGHGQSEGNPEGAYYSPAYTIDVLNAVASLQKYPPADPNRIGMWGHSMGGHITLRAMVVSSHIKAGVIWGAVVASYQDMAENLPTAFKWGPSEKEKQSGQETLDSLLQQYGDFYENPKFWQAVTPLQYVQDISGPIQIHHALYDDDVPLLFSHQLKEALERNNKSVEMYTYDDTDHNISKYLTLALKRSVEFFNTHL